MKLDVVQLTKDLVSFESESRRSNAEISAYLEDTMQRCGFEVERLEYSDENGVRKVSIVGRKGEGTGGLALLSHTDTVPGTTWDRDPCAPVIEGGRLIGLGSCDMKGPLAATLVAAAEVDASRLRRPVFVVATADEEVGGGGALQVANESVLFQETRPEHGVIAEPTGLVPVYAHKGGGRIIVTAYGRAAHTSTDRGISANFLIAPFLAEMAELAELFKTDERFQNQEFDPPTNGFNMVIDDGGCRPNVSAAKTVCTLSFRTMPNDHHEELIAMVTERAQRRGFEVSSYSKGPFYISPEAEIVQVALKATGVAQPRTVPYGTDAFAFKDQMQLVILGPGDIVQAHTVGEYIELDQLTRAVDVYQRMIEQLCI